MRATFLGIAGALAVLLVGAPAEAQKVYVNDVECTGIVNARFEGATVVFDDQGNVRITAPGYRVQVIQPGSGTTPPTTTTTTTTSGGTGGASGTGQTVVYSDSGRPMTTTPATYQPPIVEQTTTTVVTTAGGTGTTTTPTTTTTSPSPPSTGTGTAEAPPRPPGAAAPTKRYFLITQGTGGAAVGETIQVNINGRQVRQVDSAGSQVITDITDHLNAGANSVTMLSTKKPTFTLGLSSSTFQVIIGEGHVEAGGRVVIDLPVVTYTRTAADATAGSRNFTLNAR